MTAQTSLGRNGERTATVSLPEDRQLTYTEYGPSSGTPVVFFHGTPGSRRLGKVFETTVHTNDVRLLAIDRPGYGRSTPWPDRSIRDTGQFVSAVLDDADVTTADVIAFSGGSPYALAVAATHSDRVDRLDIVAGATPPAVTDEQPTVQQLLRGMATTTPRLLRGAFRVQAWLARRRDPSVVVSQYTAGNATETIPERVAELVRKDFVEAFVRHRSGVVTECRHVASDWNVDFEAIDGDVRLWHGQNDTNVPIAAVRRFESTLPTAQLQVLDDADHLQTLLQCVPEILGEY